MEDIIGLILIIAAVVALGLVIVYWQYFVVGFFVIGGIWFTIVEMKKANLAARAREAERERIRHANLTKTKEHEAKQQSIGKELVTLSSLSLQEFESMPKELFNAEQFLDQAERDFQENAFSPFWTSIEQATTQLGTFDAYMLDLGRLSQRYELLTKTYERTAPQFPINMQSVSSMGAAKATAERMKAIVRKAQTNFHFAMIYEQRKTNQLLIAGFTNLAQALDGMGHRIACSIDELGGQISAMSSVMQEEFQSLGEIITEGNQQIVEGVGALHSTAMQSTSELRDIKERHDRALQALDNIQRHRQPIGFYSGLFTKPAP